MSTGNNSEVSIYNLNQTCFPLAFSLVVKVQSVENLDRLLTFGVSRCTAMFVTSRTEGIMEVIDLALIFAELSPVTQNKEIYISSKKNAN